MELHVVSLVSQSSEPDSKPAAWQVKLFFLSVNDPCTDMFEEITRLMEGVSIVPQLLW